MTTTLNLRSTKTINDYVKTVDTMKLLAKKLSDLSKIEAKLRPQVIAEIGDRREVEIRKQVRILEPQVKESIGQQDSEATVERFKAIGLPVNVRSAEWVAPASFGKLVKEGAVPEDLIKRTSEVIVVVH